jgi:hypothetical protein
MSGVVNRVGLKDFRSNQELLDGFLENPQGGTSGHTRRAVPTEIKLAVPWRGHVAAHEKRYKQFWPVCAEVGGELGVVKIKQAAAKAPCFTVDDTEDLHLLSLAEADETHKGQLGVEIPHVSQSVLAIDLGKDLAVGGNVKRCVVVNPFPYLPYTMRRGTEVERQGNRRAS